MVVIMKGTIPRLPAFFSMTHGICLYDLYVFSVMPMDWETRLGTTAPKSSKSAAATDQTNGDLMGNFSSQDFLRLLPGNVLNMKLQRFHKNGFTLWHLENGALKRPGLSLQGKHFPLP